MELFSYWPPIIQDIVEFRQIANAEQPEFDTVAATVRAAPDDFFLVSLSEYGVRRWEAILGLSVAPGDTLEERRERVIFKYFDRLPYTYRMLLRYLATVSASFAVRLTADAYEIFIRIVLSGYSQRAELAEILRKMIPANMVIHLQSGIPQTVQSPPTVIAAGVTTRNRHEHIPQGG